MPIYVKNVPQHSGKKYEINIMQLILILWCLPFVMFALKIQELFQYKFILIEW